MSALVTGSAPVGQCLAPLGLKTSPELELLLLCARRKLSVDHARRVRDLLDHPLDWNRLVQQAEAHRLLPLLYWHVTRSLDAHFPPEIEAQLEERFRSNVVRSLLLVRDLASVVELLASRGIQVIPFKGPTLAESLYGDPCLRDCVDLDFLIHSRDLPEAIRTLVSAGYDATKEVNPARQKAFVNRQYEYALLSPAGILIELQWRIVPHYFSLPVLEEEYWKRVQPRMISGREMNLLSPEELLLLLCFHGGKHGWERLIWVGDVAELIASNPQVDWKYVLDRARLAGGLRMLLLGVVLGNRLLGSDIPNELERPLNQDAEVEKIAATICHDLVARERPSYVKSQVYLLRVRERWRDRLRYLVRFTLTDTPAEWEIVTLPFPLAFLYRLLRVLRGFVKGSSLAVEAISRQVRARL